VTKVHIEGVVSEHAPFTGLALMPQKHESGVGVPDFSLVPFGVLADAIGHNLPICNRSHRIVLMFGCQVTAAVPTPVGADRICSMKLFAAIGPIHQVRCTVGER